MNRMFLLAALIFLMAASGLYADFAMDTSLADSDASFVGEAAEDDAGTSVANVGDVNGDGYATDGAEPLSNWRTFEDPDPQRAERYNARHPPKPFRFDAITDATDCRILAAGSVLVLVNSTLYSSIEDDLSVYEQDLITAGYGVTFATAEGGTQQQIRARLQGYYNAWGASFRGCLLVGCLPIPWFQHFNDWDGYEDVFACDLYYADMDGLWTDTNYDGLLDSHTNGSGDTRPEIWIGRVTAHDMSDGEITLVKRFFADNHQYRLGNRNLPKRALLYQDDDWATYPGWYYAFAALINDRHWISDTDTTNASDYKSRFDDGYQWLLVCSHSDPSFHSFDTSSGWTYCYWDEVRDGNPNFNFSITYACSNADYSCSDYMSGWYLLAGGYTQLVLGTTKTGGFWYGYEFFDSLANGESLGRSYNNWLSAEYPYDDDDISCWYGLTLLGDPSLYFGDNYSPQLSDPTHSPKSGRTDTDYTFTVHYYHAGGQAPSRIQVFVNHTPHDMTLDSGTADNGTYTWSGLIPEGGLAQYHFEAEDAD